MTTEYRELNPRDGNGRRPFPEHNEHMREFHKSHARVALVNLPRLEESAFLASLRPLPLRHTIKETGGTYLPDSIRDWSELLPMLKMAQHRLSPN